ncbi:MULTISPECIES: hypothetical protein [Colwellia]|uniref:Outer membrane beta barrel protein n=1 Tax=Colwellia marinimaniae TaxID=1513592 RepID=A0ABQ0MUA4_9GAMM|nr:MULTISPECIES: hypothetical protein [Colwellia]GAW95958.1 outer membrane beta barrel protein [Colwellia marinimaniae]
MKKLTIFLLPLCFSQVCFSTEKEELSNKVKQLEIEIQQLKKAVNAAGNITAEKNTAANRVVAEEDAGIILGGAVRFQYVYEDYNDANTNRGGDLDFDLFRLDLNGQIGGVILSAQYRWFQYMNVIHHAWLGYDFDEHWQGQIGITRVPFGNLDYNSHNYFFSSNYYVGLEDDYDAGIKFIRKTENHDLRVAFFFTDEMGGIDGYVDNRTDRYSYDIVGVRASDEGIYQQPSLAAAEHNTLSLRYAYQLANVELGFSWLSGDIRDATSSIGDRTAFALHTDAQFNRWNIKLQYTDYEYNFDSYSPLLAVGAYSFYDSIPSEAKLYSVNIAYLKPVEFGPISSLNFYNNYNLMTDKSADFDNDTIMNVLGVAISAGGLYTYVDLVRAKNQPFIGGTMAGDSKAWQTRFNINVGYYF